MKSLTALLIIALLVTGWLTFQPATYAQDTSPVETPVVETPPDFPDELPETAGDAIPFLREWLLFVAALVSTHIMNGFKRILGLGNQKWLAKLVTELLSGVSASVIAFLLGLAAVGLGFLDVSGLWKVILFAWPAAVGIYHGKKFSKAGSAAVK